MQFKINGQKMAEYPNFMWSYEGRYLMILKAIELDTSNMQVWPQYRQAFDLVRSAGQVCLTVYIGNYAFRLILQGRRPFVHFSIHEQEIQVNEY